MVVFLVGRVKEQVTLLASRAAVHSLNKCLRQKVFSLAHQQRMEVDSKRDRELLTLLAIITVLINARKFSASLSLYAQIAKNLIFASIAAMSYLCGFGNIENYNLGHESLRDLGQSTPRPAACNMMQPLSIMHNKILI